jgi:YD repeat-containing protein
MGSSTEDARIKYYNYDRYGNPVYITKDDATMIVYIWSYMGQYPVAEIINATYAEVNAALSKLGLTNIDAICKTTTPNIDKIRSLRTELSNASVSVYSYQPLIGILTATDPSGITTYYDYDPFGRLEETYIIENNVKKIIQSYNYNYKNK